MFVSTRKLAKALLIDLLAAELPGRRGASGGCVHPLFHEHLLVSPCALVESLQGMRADKQIDGLPDEVGLSHAERLRALFEKSLLGGTNIDLFAYEGCHSYKRYIIRTSPSYCVHRFER